VPKPFMTKDEATEAVDSAISELVNFDLVLVKDGDASPSSYVQNHRHEYIRTVRDILSVIPAQSGRVRVLEIGSFFGVVCMALKHLGYEVTAADIPEYIELPEQAKRYSRHGITTASVRLEDFILPFSDEVFDVVIMCEVLEHLNFNPLPLLKEINRIGKPNSTFYLSLPNGANIYNRRAVVRGRGIGIDVNGHFEQLNPRSSVIANGHWKEYTGSEVRQMLEPLGFRIAKQYYFSLGETQPARSLRKKLARIIYERFPALKENQTTIAIREKRTNIIFRIPTTVHRSLKSV
jgi:SAM-dependent methyltransferase